MNTRLQYTLSQSWGDERRNKAHQFERAIVLRQLLSRENLYKTARGLILQNAQLAAVIMSMHPAVQLRVRDDLVPELHEISLSLAYRMGATLYCSRYADSVVLYNDELVRRLLASRGSPLAQAPARVLQRRLFTREVPEEICGAPAEGVLSAAAELSRKAFRGNIPLRNYLHVCPPAVVLSTPGVPALVESTLTRYLESFIEFEHTRAPVYVFDDSIRDPAAMESVIARLRERFLNPIHHISERSSGGGPGVKARLRNYLAQALCRVWGDPLESWTHEHFGAGLAGSANLAFWHLDGQSLVCLDQDATPETVRMTNSGFLSEDAEGFDCRIERCPVVEGVDYISGTLPPGTVVEPVDVLYLADWFLDARPADVSIRLAGSEWRTREDLSYERVRGVTDTEMPPIRICTFHICGHQDSRARLLHLALLGCDLDYVSLEAILAGGLPFFAVCESPIPLTVVRHSKTGFGTAIAFSGNQPIRPIPMLVTTVRLVDYSVGLLLENAGPGSIAWAPAGLLHVRASETRSGRGALARYLYNEDLLFPLLELLRRESETAPEFCTLGSVFAQQAETFQLPPGYADVLYCHAEASIRQIRNGPQQPHALCRYAADLQTVYGVRTSAERPLAIRELHDSMQQQCRQELKNYSQQLAYWHLLEDVRSPFENALGE